MQPIHGPIRWGDEAVETAGGAVSDGSHSWILRVVLVASEQYRLYYIVI
jgi:hypothetical protein